MNLYTLQQELARHQMLLEKEHDHFGEINQDRQRMEQDLKQIKEKHAKKKEEVDTQMRQSNSLRKFSNESYWERLIVALDTQKERDVLQRRLHYMNKAKSDIRGDLSTMRRATEKVDSEVAKLEADKKIQVRRGIQSTVFEWRICRICMSIVLFNKSICFANKFPCTNINYAFKVI